MRRILLAALCLGPLLLMGCPPPLHVEDTATFTGVTVRHININQSFNYRLQVPPAGDLVFVVQSGTGEPQRYTGQLTPDEITALFNAFKGWGRLDPYYPGDWTNMIQITYNDYTVEVHDPLQAPKQFLTVQNLLTADLNRILQASTRAAPSQPASQPAPATGP